MSLMTELAPEVQAELVRQAAKQGAAVETYVASLIESAALGNFVGLESPIGTTCYVRFFQSSLFTWRARPNASVLAGTWSVITLPAAI